MTLRHRSKVQFFEPRANLSRSDVGDGFSSPAGPEVCIDHRGVAASSSVLIGHLFGDVALEEGVEGHVAAARVFGAFVELQQLPLDLLTDGLLGRIDCAVEGLRFVNAPAVFDNAVTELPGEPAGTRDAANGPMLIALASDLQGNRISSFGRSSLS